MRSASQPSPFFEESGPARDMLLVPATLSSLPFIGARLHAFVQEAAGTVSEAKEVHDLRLAVQEACTNIIKHGQLANEERRLAVRFELAERLVSVLITARGEPFDPRREASLPSQEIDYSEGGYGLFLIQALVDKVDYMTAEGGNTLVLAKRLPAGEES